MLDIPFETDIEKDDFSFCKKCGVPNENTREFCWNCEQKLDSDPQLPNQGENQNDDPTN